MNKITFLLDPGHGGIINNKYTTSPTFNKNDRKTWKKCFYHQDLNLEVFEGVINRQIIALVKKECDKHNLKYLDVVNSDQDISLEKRVTIANNFYKTDKNCFYFSCHSNACNEIASGFEIFTSVGQTKTDFYADLIIKEIMSKFPTEKFRVDTTDNDLDKESNFYVIKNTNMPAVLLESWFFDNKVDVLKLVNKQVQQVLAEAIVQGFKKIEENWK